MTRQEELQARLKALRGECMHMLNVAEHEKRAFTKGEQATFDRRVAERSEIEAVLAGDTEGLSGQWSESLGRQTETTLASTSLSNVPPAVTTTTSVGARRGNLAAEVRARGLEEDAGDLSIERLVLSAIRGPKTDAERRALSAGTDSAGGYSVPTIVSARFVDDSVFPVSAVMQAGATVTTIEGGKERIVKLAAAPSVTWHAENASITPADPTFGAITWAPKTLVCVTKFSLELAEDGQNIEQMLQQTLGKALAAEIDRAALFGTGTSNQPLGLKGISGVNSVSMGTNGAAPTSYDEVLDAVQLNLEDNAPMPTGFVGAPRTLVQYGKLKTGISSDKTPLQKPPLIEDIPWYQTTNVPVNETQGSASTASRLFAGYWPSFMIGFRAPIRIEVSRERFLADELAYAVVCYARVDFAVTAAGYGIVPSSVEFG